MNFQIDAWESETVKECILALARGKGFKISDETAEQMTTLIGGRCFPYYVQVFFESTCDHLFSKERDSYSIEELSEIYDKYLIRGNDMGPALNHMVERLKKSLSEREYDLAQQILKKLAQNEGVTAKSEIRSIKDEADEESGIHVLNILKHDGYIDEEKNGYLFINKPLRDWWRNKHGV
jgi:hypothetical protein